MSPGVEPPSKKGTLLLDLLQRRYCVVGGTDGLIGGVLVVIGVFSVVHYYVRSGVDGKGRKRLWQVGNW